jgi:dTDP-4-dehydrorhamnose 3,5-epimerase
MLVIHPRIHADERGRLFESLRTSAWAAAGLPPLVQQNVSVSARGVVRGLHFQRPPHAQGKLVQVLRGAVHDVVLDLRDGSPTCGRWASMRLGGDEATQLWVPPGFAHGFQALDNETIVSYFLSTPYEPSAEGAFHPLSPSLGIEWPLADVRLSPKDADAPDYPPSGVT